MRGNPSIKPRVHVIVHAGKNFVEQLVVFGLFSTLLCWSETSEKLAAMIITIKTLQTKTFKVEIDESETVCLIVWFAKVKNHAIVKWVFRVQHRTAETLTEGRGRGNAGSS